MDRSSHTLACLFAQLGLANSDKEIEREGKLLLSKLSGILNAKVKEHEKSNERSREETPPDASSP